MDEDNSKEMIKEYDRFEILHFLNKFTDIFV